MPRLLVISRILSVATLVIVVLVSATASKGAAVITNVTGAVTYGGNNYDGSAADSRNLAAPTSGTVSASSVFRYFDTPGHLFSSVTVNTSITVSSTQIRILMGVDIFSLPRTPGMSPELRLQGTARPFLTWNVSEPTAAEVLLENLGSTLPPNFFSPPIQESLIPNRFGLGFQRVGNPSTGLLLPSSDTARFFKWSVPFDYSDATYALNTNWGYINWNEDGWTGGTRSMNLLLQITVPAPPATIALAAIATALRRNRR